MGVYDSVEFGYAKMPNESGQFLTEFIPPFWTALIFLFLFKVLEINILLIPRT